MSKDIIDSWNENSASWIDILERKGISSRKLTSPAILKAIELHASGSIWDLGCGEGWLVRTLNSEGYEVQGIDASIELISRARMLSDDTYHCLSYQEIISGASLGDSPIDLIVINYALFENDETCQLFSALRNLLNAGGKIIIQTVHPFALCGENQPYTSRWIDNAWAGLNGEFISPYAWYFRTFSDWMALFSQSGYYLIDLIEPCSQDGKVVSAIFVIKKNQDQLA